MIHGERVKQEETSRFSIVRPNTAKLWHPNHQHYGPRAVHGDYKENKRFDQQAETVFHMDYHIHASNMSYQNQMKNNIAVWPDRQRGFEYQIPTPGNKYMTHGAITREYGSSCGKAFWNWHLENRHTISLLAYSLLRERGSAHRDLYARYYLRDAGDVVFYDDYPVQYSEYTVEDYASFSELHASAIAITGFPAFFVPRPLDDDMSKTLVTVNSILQRTYRLSIKEIRGRPKYNIMSRINLEIDWVYAISLYSEVPPVVFLCKHQEDVDRYVNISKLNDNDVLLTEMW